MDSEHNSKNRKTDFKSNKDKKPGKSNSYGFTTMFFAAISSLHRKLDTFIPLIWAKAGKVEENVTPQKKRKAEENVKEGEALPKKQKRDEEKSSPKKETKRPRTETEEPEEGKAKRFKGENQHIDEPKQEPEPSGSVVPKRHPGLLSKCKFYRELGKGGYGKVLLAQELDTKQLVAVKVVAKSKILNCVSSVMIEKELLEAAKNSAFLTPAYVTFQTKDNIYFVMEYLEGGSLYKFYRQKKTFDIDTIRFLAAEIICGLNFLHARGYIHRDLKLGNVLLDGRGHAKIADFGLATHIINGKAKGCIGTPGYVAPEVLDDKEYDYSVDYYSLGIMLFRIATGLKTDQLYTPEGKVHLYSLNPELKDLILKFLCVNPEKRMTFVSSIKDHPFFEPIDWEALESGKLSPPYTMPRPNKLGKSVPYKTLMCSNAETVPISASQQELFKGIPYVKL